MDDKSTPETRHLTRAEQRITGQALRRSLKIIDGLDGSQVIVPADSFRAWLGAQPYTAWDGPLICDDPEVPHA